jgi:hypothetical protein
MSCAAGDPAASPHPVPKTLSEDHPPPFLVNEEPQVSGIIQQESRIPITRSEFAMYYDI